MTQNKLGFLQATQGAYRMALNWYFKEQCCYVESCKYEPEKLCANNATIKDFLSPFSDFEKKNDAEFGNKISW